MYYKVESPDKYADALTFNKGSGFYIVDYKGFQGMQDDVFFYNNDNNLYYGIGMVSEIPKEVLDLFEKTGDKKDEADIEKPINYVSEEFALKAMAMAKANSQTVKVSDILK